MTESAIPQHLTVERTRAPRTPEGYRPRSPAFVARPDARQERVVMAYLGAQGRPAELPPGPDGPRHHDRAVDPRGGDTVVVAYWDDPATFDRWFAAQREPWLDGPGGRWLEVLRPAVDRYETVFGRRSRPEGVAVLAEGFSGDVLEHGYWGSMRDRFPASQTDALHDPGDVVLGRDGDRVRVRPTGSVALIRSGQDWSGTEPDERERYLGEIEPALRTGMDVLRDDGVGVGCWSNRYLTVLDDGAPAERTFGLSWWRSLADLEQWAATHPDHLQIFGSFVRMVEEQGGTRIRPDHEVSLARPDECWFEYARCEPGTGLLNAAPEPS